MEDSVAPSNLGSFTEPIDSEEITTMHKIGFLLSNHLKGMTILFSPILAMVILSPFPPEDYQWCAYCLVIMAIFWVTEAIPLAVTSFIPVLMFPLTGLMDTEDVCMCYFNDTVLMFIASLFLAYSIEQSGLHKRLALNIIRLVGYSHRKLLFAMSMTTMFVSFWITNTAATTMMIPINFAILQVFENQNILSIYEVNDVTGEKAASDITTCYFCAATFSASIGGIGTLVGTGTNLALKGLFTGKYPSAPEYMAFPLFSAFGIPYAIILEIFCCLCLSIQYLGLFRPNSKQAKGTTLSEDNENAVKEAISQEIDKMGRISFWEIMVALLFSTAMVGFFLRSPQMFTGWGDKIIQDMDLPPKFIRDSSWAYLIAVTMMLLPYSLEFFDYFKPKVPNEDLRKQPIRSILDWNLMAAVMPFSFAFLLGGGFALAEAAKKGLNEKIGRLLSSLGDLPNEIIILILIIFTIFVTNFASNVAVCNVVAPIAMTLAVEINQNPLLYAIAVGFSASYCFILPVGTPGNIIVQGAASIPTMKMIKAGAAPTLCTIVITWVAVCYWSPVIWPDLHSRPNWIPMKNLSYQY